MGKTLEDLREKLTRLEIFRRSLESQDGVLKEAGPKQEVPIPGATPIKHIFDNVELEFPGLVPPFEYYGTPLPLRAQIRLAIDNIAERIGQLSKDILAVEGRHALRAPIDAARTFINTRRQEGKILMTYGGSDLADLDSRLTRWSAATIRTLEQLFESPWHAEQFGGTIRAATVSTVRHTEPSALWQRGMERVRYGVEYLSELDEHFFLVSSQQTKTGSAARGKKVFVGHGRSPIWRELKDFLADTLHLEWDEYNRVSSAGLFTPERLDEMLSEAAFAFVILTGEDEQPDGSVRARENAVHETGLFQGRLGFKRAIILLEDGCQTFSNISGLTVIPFPKGHLQAAFEQVRNVLQREGVLKAALGMS